MRYVCCCGWKRRNRRLSAVREELADVEEGLREIERGEVATDEEVAALFDRMRR